MSGERWVFGMASALFVFGCASSTAGVSVEQARSASPRGAKVYERECSGCHGDDGGGLSGTPRVMGAGALPLRGASGKLGPLRSAKDVFDYVSSEMPLPKARVGSLPEADYWAVVEFMLRGAGKDVPAEGLSAATASSIVVNAP